ncbi:DUF1559 domain-containing protein [Blastopirellula sp. J2-11]|nr:DUF1559 domain-containing protein [Blastopirellula sp. J2-11]
MGLALHNHHDTFGSFPPGMAKSLNSDGTDADLYRSFGWQTYILPFIEQANIHAAIQEVADFKVRTGLYTSLGCDCSLPELKTVIEGYRCPSANTPDLATDGDTETCAISNYAGCYGNTPEADNWSGNGAMPIRNGRVVRMRDITDGLSGTFMVGEVATPTNADDVTAPKWAGGEDNEKWEVIRQTSTGHNPNEHEKEGFTSQHSGGVQVLACDGSAHFIAETIDSTTYQRLSNINWGTPAEWP